MSKSKYAGMTVNERLYVSGLIKDFDKAVAAGDKLKVIEILKQVDLNDESIKSILEQLDLK